MKSSAMLVLLGLVLSSAALGDSIFVEGQIRNLRTGMPLRGALVSLTDPFSVPAGFPPEVVGKPSLTDDSGFFSIELEAEELDRGSVDISAKCKTTDGVRQTDRLNHPVALRSGTIRRDLFIEAFRRPRNRTCQALLGFVE